MFSLAALIPIIAPDWPPIPNLPSAPFSGIAIDSRQVQPGNLFIAFPGENSDGHNYVANAFAQGAQAALIQRPLDQPFPTLNLHAPPPANLPANLTNLCLLVPNTLTTLQQLATSWRTQFDLPVVGITGSVGKTSTKELVASVLAQNFNILKTPGNYNNEIGLPLTLLGLNQTHQWAVFEMGMYARGEIERLCQIAGPQIGVITNVGPVHLERLGSIEAIAAAKQELVEALPPSGTAILNYDEPLVMSMAPHTPANIFTYGLNPQADLWADNIETMGLDGLRFHLHYQNETIPLHVPLLGRHSVHTALRAAAVGLVAGLSWPQIIAGLQNNEDQLRLVVIPGPRDSLLIDDTYNASPASAIAALNLLNDINGRHIAVLGDMLELGSAEEESHRRVGRRARDVAHILVAVGSRGRIIGEEALNVGMPPANVHFATDPAAATAILEKIIRSQDIILIKGSLGARLERIVANLSRMV
ncbi:MAG TPA: UDP-N-acetylmuramoyl-tripeptide--D-alanyl-D-alanine ligase [Anaerolineae bacterium]|nr:UDP-N-acetylmuramoyl-tripeptide--D-alanyl-D-alanine ligase [Anaerolineae bacterium]